jgi:hypothetical protein
VWLGKLMVRWWCKYLCNNALQQIDLYSSGDGQLKHHDRSEQHLLARHPSHQQGCQHPVKHKDVGLQLSWILSKPLVEHISAMASNTRFDSLFRLIFSNARALKSLPVDVARPYAPDTQPGGKPEFL